MNISVRNECADAESYRATRVKSMFNVISGATFGLKAQLDIDDEDWGLGLVVGPSGSGKTSIGRELFGPGTFYAPRWPKDKPIVDAIAPRGDFDAVTAALASVGLGTVPSWLRPYRVLSTGEQFRANMARLIMEAPAKVVLDEFTSVVDRQIAKIGALAFAKAWKRTGGQAVLLSCHYDIIEWLEPDWVFDTATGEFQRGRNLWRRPRFDVEVWETDWSHWRLFEPHHYLKVPKMIAAQCYVATVDGEPVAHYAVGTRPGLREARGCRLVVMPEWQGAGVGLRFLNTICQRWLEGKNRFARRMPTLFHTSHPGLCAALRRRREWVQVSAALHGGNKTSSARTIRSSGGIIGSGYGGHFRAVQGFRYLGPNGAHAERGPAG